MDHLFPCRTVIVQSVLPKVIQGFKGMQDKWKSITRAHFFPRSRPFSSFLLCQIQYLDEEKGCGKSTIYFMKFEARMRLLERHMEWRTRGSKMPGGLLSFSTLLLFDASWPLDGELESLPVPSPIISCVQTCVDKGN